MTTRERRVVGFGLALALVSATLLRVLPEGWRRYRALQERAELVRRLAGGQAAELSGLSDLESRSDTLRRAVLALADRLIAGGTDAEAQAELLASIEVASERTTARINQLEPVPDSVGFGRIRRVQARANVTTDLVGLLRVVKAIEWSPRLMLVRRLRLELSSEAAAVETVRAELLVEGWYLRREDVE